MEEGNENLVYPSPWDFKRFLTCRELLRHGTYGFTSRPKKGVLQIFIALKNPSPWPGFQPATFESSGKHINHYTTKATGNNSSPRGSAISMLVAPEFLGTPTTLLNDHKRLCVLWQLFHAAQSAK
jgi:hypothetical protein